MKYIDRDKLKSHLEYLAQRDRNYAKECSDNTDFDRQRKYCFEANVLAYELCMAVMDYYIIPDVQPVDRWISVNDRLPELGRRVLVCYHFWADKDKVYQIAYLKETKNDGIQFVTYEGFNLPTVTHWQPLPEQPETMEG